MDLGLIIKECKSLAIEAGREIMKIYVTDFDVEMKEDESPLTMADKKSNEIIVTGLRSRFSKVSILSEESRDDKSRLKNDYCFIVDPLDGTKEFVKKNGQFTVNIALAYKQEVILGVIYVPTTGELYYACKDQGSYYVRIPSVVFEGENSRIKVSNKTEDLVLVGSKSHFSEREVLLIEANRSKIKDVLSAGSSLKGCMVAKGQADVYYRFGLTSEWDTAAMHCIVEEAGGVFRQMDGSEMIYNRENTLNDKGFYIVNRKENIWV